MREQGGPGRLLGDGFQVALAEREQAARDLHVKLLERGVGLQRLSEEDAVELRLLGHEREVRSQRRLHGFGRLLGGADPALQVLGGTVDHGLEELPLAGEVLVEEGLRDPGRGRYLARGGGVIAAGPEDRLGRVEDGPPPLGCGQPAAGL